MKTINIAKDYTPTPGARYKSDGPGSGEEFREGYLVPYFVDDKDEKKIEIVFDGAAGYATSFLDEAFGALARKYGADRCMRKLIFVSKEDPILIDEIKQYIYGKND